MRKSEGCEKNTTDKLISLWFCALLIFAAVNELHFIFVLVKLETKEKIRMLIMTGTSDAWMVS